MIPTNDNRCKINIIVGLNKVKQKQIENDFYWVDSNPSNVRFSSGISFPYVG